MEVLGKHKNVLTLLDTFHDEVEDIYWLVMELCESGSLDDYI
jgi:serine/threonine protein kinase